MWYVNINIFVNGYKIKTFLDNKNTNLIFTEIRKCTKFPNISLVQQFLSLYTTFWRQSSQIIEIGIFVDLFTNVLIGLNVGYF